MQKYYDYLIKFINKPIIAFVLGFAIGVCTNINITIR